MPIRVVLVDDHPLVREGFKFMLSSCSLFEVVGESSDGAQVLTLVEELEPDVLVLDVTMPGHCGIEVVRRLTERRTRCRVLMLSIHADESYVIAALRAGALGYVLKSSDSEELIRAVRIVASGQHYLGQPLSHRAIARYAGQDRVPALDPYETLSPRERQILQLVAEGLSNLEAAARLSLSPRTVESHRASLMRKLDLSSSPALIRYAIRKGIIKLEEGPGGDAPIRSETGKPAKCSSELRGSPRTADPRRTNS